jgi:hypothetical protein
MTKPTRSRSEPKQVMRISLPVLTRVLTGVRAQLLNRLIEAPLTIQALAAEFTLPVTRLYYHVHLLEEHGLVRVVAEHPAGGTIEKVYRATARQFLLDRAQFAAPGPAALAQAKMLTNVGLRQTAQDIQRSVAAGLIDLRQVSPAPQSLFIRRAFGQLSRARAAQFHQRLAELMDEFTQPDTEPPTATDAGYALLLAFYPSGQASVPAADERG